MCLIAFAYSLHPAYSLILAANRDEFYARPATRADWWHEHPDVLAGKDLGAGGTWLGVTRSGRFSALTNIREPHNVRPDAPSRGMLVLDYLAGPQTPQAYLEAQLPGAAAFNGFNLLAGDRQGLYYLSNRTAGVQALAPGVYGLSNALLDTPWPKVRRAKEVLAQWMAAGTDDFGPLFGVMAEEHYYPDEELPHTGIRRDLERRVSAARIHLEEMDYGTRVTTVVGFRYDGTAAFEERAHAPAGEPKRFEFLLTP
ncbi:MAG: NRDE family protein [Bacteroidia bacterium]